MKRLKNIYEQTYSMQNLLLADEKARKHKHNQRSIIEFDKNRGPNLLKIQQDLINKTYNTSAYTTFTIREPKERLIFRLPYGPDRVTHHAIMIPLQKMFTDCFISQTYSCIKGKGINAATYDLRRALNDRKNTTYCLKLDIKKFYPSIDHAILKTLLRKKIGDKDMLWLLDEIIDSATGLPIGNYLSQYFANFYLTYFDHYIKQTNAVKYYFRYSDDIVILSPDKNYLHNLLAKIKQYLLTELNLHVKQNYQVFPVAKRGIDFVGYVHWHGKTELDFNYTKLRKSIKQNCARALAKNPKALAIAASYKGWLKHGDCIQLSKKLKLAA